jgi:acyl-CoA thioesterase
MWARDNAAHALGIDLLAVGSNFATLQVIIAPQHRNSHTSCHRGVIITLADCAFAYAFNSGAEMAATQANFITHPAPGIHGDALTARAALVSRTGRTAILDVTVTSASSHPIALLRA